jgi:hypothetical protein
VLTPTSASWANPIEAQFGPLRSFTMANSNYPNHTVLARDMQAYLRWRNANARHPDVLAAQRRERARIRSERQQRWGRPRSMAARPQTPRTGMVNALARIDAVRASSGVVVPPVRGEGRSLQPESGEPPAFGPSPHRRNRLGWNW